jgi:hypothetical protein
MTRRPTLAALINLHGTVPDRPYISVVEATSSIAFKAFLGGDHLAAVFQSATKDEKLVGRANAERQKAIEKSIKERKPVEHGKPVKDWLEASEKIREAAHAGTLTLRGLRAKRFGDEPTGEERRIPNKFFAGKNMLVITPNGTLYRNDPTRKLVYYDVSVGKEEFTQVFPLAEVKHLAATPKDRQAVLLYAEGVYASTSQAPTFGQYRAKFRQFSQHELRKLIAEPDFPRYLRRERGEKSH